MSPETRMSGMGVPDVVELEVAHGAGDVRERDREGAPKAAALLPFPKLDHPDP